MRNQARPLLTSTVLFLLQLSWFVGSSPCLGNEPLTNSASIADDVLQRLADEGVEEALEELGTHVDRGMSTEEIIDSRLPSATAGLYRSLSQLSSDEQYDLLSEWSLPTQERNSVRILATPVPVDAPPKVFVRTIGERPRDTSFPIADVAGVRGLFCSGWMLVQAADEIGRLSILMRELEKSVDQKIPGARELCLLAQIADRRGQAEQVQTYLTQIGNSDVADNAESIRFEGSELVSVAIAAAALSKATLRPHSESALQRFVGRDTRLKPLLRIAHATAVQINRGESPATVLYENRLRHWIPATGKTAIQSSTGAPNAMWLSHEDHVLHLSGGNNDVLFFRYPLIGKFDFTCETQEGGDFGTDGGLVYGGLHFEALVRTNKLTVWDADKNHGTKKTCPFVRQEKTPTFNRVSIRATEESVAFEANLHPIRLFEEASKTSPWVGLRSDGKNRPVFRNLRIEGTPVIPREVRLVDTDQLRGWESGFFGESQRPFSPDQGRKAESAETNINWHVDSGTLVAKKAGEESEATLPSLLRYQRPLLDGESITYEFEHRSGAVAVHPTVGRLVFLLHQDGVQVRWITDGEWDWTGLPQDNATLEPFNRRGPKPLPLIEGEWNRVNVSRIDGKLNITLNDQLVYQRSVDFDGSKQFGLYRKTRRDETRVRKVVMTGDWPEHLPADLLNNPLMLADATAPRDDRRVLCALIGEETVASNVRAVRRKIVAAEPDRQFELLCEWVLPSDNHANVRMAGFLSPSHASPEMLNDDAFRRLVDDHSDDFNFQPTGPHGSTAINSGEAQAYRSPRTKVDSLLSPVLDLFDLAKQTDRLEELRHRVQSIRETENESKVRAKAALLSLLELEGGNEETVAQSLEKLRELIETASSHTSQDAWLELLVIHRAMHRSLGRQAVDDLLAHLYINRIKNAGADVDEAWQSQLMQHVAQLWVQQWAGTDAAIADSQFPSNWHAASESNAAARGAGRATARWERNRKGEVVHLAGHHLDFLYFQSPLRGNYTIEADIPAHGGTQVRHGDEVCGPGNSLEKFEVGSSRQFRKWVQLDKPFDKPNGWIRYRVDVTDNTSRVFFNGRLVRQRNLPEDGDPWFAFRTWWTSNTTIRDVAISGSPTIPDEVPLSCSPDLSGWQSYYRTSVATDDAHWRWIDDASDNGDGIIIGKRRDDVTGSACERLLQYHRPLIEDGSIDLEFFYEPGERRASPALGRLAFVFQPNGVYEHWVTDGQYDTTLVRPDNLNRPKSHQRGGDSLPLIPNGWNRVRLELAGATLQILLNGSVVYERSLPEKMERTIGLFHFADLHELRVRKVVMRGDWPKRIPIHQDLADPLVASIDAGLPALSSVFTHDFRDSAQTDRYVAIASPPNQSSAADDPAGKRLSVASPGKWTELALLPRFSLQGDFDIEAGFSGLEPDQPTKGGAYKEGGAHLALQLQDEHATKVAIAIGNRSEIGHFLTGHRILHYPDGTTGYRSSRAVDESDSGRLRIARRGGTVYFLFAQEDSSRYRIVGQQPVSRGDVEVDATRLLVMAKGASRASVTWEDVVMRAEKMQFVPSLEQPATPTLAVMDVATGKLRKVAEPLAGYSNIGSAAWSPTGDKLAYDQSKGDTGTSRIMVVDIDGGKPVDIGYGSMPTFSADGRQIAFSAAGKGVGFMNADGTDRRIVDRSGWGVQWSSDGEQLAYTRGGNITLWDIETESSRALLTGQAATQYEYIYWNMSWSRDNSRIVFKGRRRHTRKDEVAIVSLATPDRVQVLPSIPANVSPDFSWSPTDDQILYSTVLPDVHVRRLFTVKSDGSQLPALLENQPENQRILCGVWSPDGQSVAMMGTPLPTPIDWPVASYESAP